MKAEDNEKSSRGKKRKHGWNYPFTHKKFVNHHTTSASPKWTIRKTNWTKQSKIKPLARANDRSWYGKSTTEADASATKKKFWNISKQHTHEQVNAFSSFLEIKMKEPDSERNPRRTGYVFISKENQASAFKEGRIFLQCRLSTVW